MNIGTQLMTLGTGSKSYYTPWFPKNMDNAYFTYEIIEQNFGSGGKIEVTVYTKNREDNGSEGSSYTSFSQIGTSTGFWEKECTNLKELVRFKITVTAGTEAPTGQEGVVYRILPPTWYDKAV